MATVVLETFLLMSLIDLFTRYIHMKITKIAFLSMYGIDSRSRRKLFSVLTKGDLQRLRVLVSQEIVGDAKLRWAPSTPIFCSSGDNLNPCFGLFVFLVETRLRVKSTEGALGRYLGLPRYLPINLRHMCDSVRTCLTRYPPSINDRNKPCAIPG